MKGFKGEGRGEGRNAILEVGGNSETPTKDSRWPVVRDFPEGDSASPHTEEKGNITLGTTVRNHWEPSGGEYETAVSFKRALRSWTRLLKGVRITHLRNNSSLGGFLSRRNLPEGICAEDRGKVTGGAEETSQQGKPLHYPETQERVNPRRKGRPASGLSVGSSSVKRRKGAVGFLAKMIRDRRRNKKWESLGLGARQYQAKKSQEVRSAGREFLQKRP